MTKKSPVALDIIRQFSEETSIHGIVHIFQTKVQKILWVVHYLKKSKYTIFFCWKVVLKKKNSITGKKYFLFLKQPRLFLES